MLYVVTFASRVALTLLFLSPPLSAEVGPCRVVVRVTDNYGNRIEAYQITMRNDGVVTYIRQDEPLRMKCGRYDLEVRARGANPESLPVNLEQLDQAVPVAMRLGAVDGPVPDCAIIGRVSGVGGAQTVRLLQLFGSSPWLMSP